ncbi:MAG: protein kinase [Gemmatimonadetes bacterium]|nr:protein kinase [Gemmatimonadota bacterium]
MPEIISRLSTALADRYRIERLLGEGGMATVYLAEDLKHHREVAVKVLRPELAAILGGERFLNEIEIAARLTHPHILPVHDSGEADGMLFYVMPYVEGESLRDLLNRETQLGLEEAVHIGREIADALSYAHGQGVIHRDIKPENVLLQSGHAVIADFGIARAVTVAGGERLTETGLSLGTPQYMSPEQATANRELDARSDIYALGCVVYEMLAGEPPHTGPTTQAIIAKLMTERPVRLRIVRDTVPESIERAVMKALAKVRADRFETAADFRTALRLEHGAEAHDAPSVPATPRDVEPEVERHSTAQDLRTLGRLVRTRTVGLPALVILVALVAVVAVPFWLRTQRERARALLPRIEQLAAEGRFGEAYELAVRAEDRLGADSSLARLMPVVSDRLSVTTEPEGAEVYLRPVTTAEEGPVEDAELIGVTPIRGLRIARSDYMMRVEKEGYAPVERMASSALPRVEVFVGASADIDIQVTLLPAGEVPEGMVFVPGGAYDLVSADAPLERGVQLDDFFVDAYEVSNEQYKAFILAGGYANRSYWKHAFVRDGRELPWEEARQEFMDRTGLPGPRSWLAQDYPEGKARHPVTDITWYEAAAYAEFVGKSLPTVAQWEKAARDGTYTHFAGVVMPWGWVSPGEASQRRANYSGTGTAPVDAYPFGLSPFGAHAMAGNVKEWTLNEMGDGHAVVGGSWEDPIYVFSSFGSFADLATSPGLGFRCVRNTPGAVGDQGAWRIDVDERTPSYTPVDEATFRMLLTHYRYDAWPLEPEVVETVETDDWIREKVRLAGSDDDDILAYLYLPKNAAAPFQTMVFVPGGNAYYEPVSDAAEWLLGPNIRSGRALLVVVMDGMVEREWEPDYVRPEPTSVRFRDLVVRNGTELRRGVDYLEMRDDIDNDRLMYSKRSESTVRDDGHPQRTDVRHRCRGDEQAPSGRLGVA